MKTQRNRHNAETKAKVALKKYATEASIKGMLWQGMHAVGLRKAKYDGLYRTHVPHILTTVALNLMRSDAVRTPTPRGQPSALAFAKLVSDPPCKPKRLPDPNSISTFIRQ